MFYILIIGLVPTFVKFIFNNGFNITFIKKNLIKHSERPHLTRTNNCNCGQLQFHTRTYFFDSLKAKFINVLFDSMRQTG